MTRRSPSITIENIIKLPNEFVNKTFSLQSEKAALSDWKIKTCFRTKNNCSLIIAEGKKTSEKKACFLWQF